MDSKGRQSCLNPIHNLGSQYVVTNVNNEFQSQSCLAIWYTHNETFEQSNCCDRWAMIQALTILVWTVEVAKVALNPTCNSKVRKSKWWPLWRMNSNLNHVLLFVILIMRSSCCDKCAMIQTLTILVWKVGIAKVALNPTNNSKVSKWWPLRTMNSNLNHVLPFGRIIIVRLKVIFLVWTNILVARRVA